MGMILVLNVLSGDNIERVLADPPLVWKVLAPDDEDIYQEARLERSRSRVGWLGRLFGKKEPVHRPVNAEEEFELSEGELADTDLDKAWSGLHFTLNGGDEDTGSPLGFLMYWGEYVADIDAGFGPPRILRPAQVKEVHEALTGLSNEEFKARYQPKLMAKREVYPRIWDDEDCYQENLDYLEEYFEELKKFIAMANANNYGLIISIS